MNVPRLPSTAVWHRTPVLSLLLVLSLQVPAFAQNAPRLLADIFQDHAVLQRDRPIPVFGSASQGTIMRPERATNASRLGLLRATLCSR